MPVAAPPESSETFVTAGGSRRQVARSGPAATIICGGVRVTRLGRHARRPRRRHARRRVDVRRGASDLFIATSAGTYHFDAGALALEVPEGGAARLFGSDVDDVWLARGDLRHRETSGWSVVSVPPAVDAMFGVSLRDAGVFIADPHGGLLFHP